MLSFVRRVRRASKRKIEVLSSALWARTAWHARPDFLIIGAHKSGTSALHRYLATHPEIAPALEKELFYFSPESYHSWPEYPGYERYRHFARADSDPAIREEALRWYHSQFRVPLPWRRRLHFEATPCYLFYPKAAQRIYEYRPDMKLIVLLRDPVERAYSAWNMYHRFENGSYPYSLLWDPRSFDDALRDELKLLDVEPETLRTDYLRRGIYHEQLIRYFRLFPREQILIIEQRELLQRQRQTLDEVCRFLGVGPFPSRADRPRVFVGEYSSGMSEWARDLLADFYAPQNQILFNLIGRRFDWIVPSEQSAEPVQNIRVASRG